MGILLLIGSFLFRNWDRISDSRVFPAGGEPGHHRMGRRSIRLAPCYGLPSGLFRRLDPVLDLLLAS